jgi:hypothetical protein
VPVRGRAKRRDAPSFAFGDSKTIAYCYHSSVTGTHRKTLEKVLAALVNGKFDLQKGAMP